MTTKTQSEKNMNTFVDVLLGETESIIAETENITEELQSDETNTFDAFIDELYEIRIIAETLQTLVVDYENDYFSVSSEEFDELSIELYQSIKYTLESFETDYFDTMTEELELSFKYMRDSVNQIHTTVTKETK
jgi:uncharacterized protein with HEPN domain